MKRILLLGSNGQLGTDLHATSPESIELLTHTRDDLDIVKGDVFEYLSETKPDVIINTTAFHRVDDCEKNPELAFSINSLAVGNLAEIAKKIDSQLVHISTDYVFDGNAEDLPLVESSQTNPINVYGKSKLSGEILVQSSLDEHFIFRVSSLFGRKGSTGKGGTNFVLSMLNQAKTKDDFRIVDDIVMSPTYSLDAARKIWKIIESGNFGIHHISNSGMCTWFDLAREIFESAGLEKSVTPVPHSEFPSIAQRPLRTPLSSERGSICRPWEESIRDFVSSLRNINHYQ